MTRARILIVENEFLIALGMQDALIQAGFECQWIASSTASARDHLSRMTFDAVVLDAKLSDGAADGLAEDLVRRGIPFVCHTGYGEETLSGVMRARPVVTKPAEPADLVRALNAVLPQSLQAI